MKKDKTKLSIAEAAEYLNISIDTLRRWDASGKLKAHRSEGGHRYYYREDLIRYSTDLFDLASLWAGSPTPQQLDDDIYCQTRDVFKARLERMGRELGTNDEARELAPLLDIMTGEIGNNSFDHNLGNWPDVPGVFFGYDLNKRIIVLADRGQGIRTTLSRVRPDLTDDIMAVRVAFTERVSGRSPEQRGNGLKLVHNVALKHPIGVTLQSGTAVAEIAKNDGELRVGLADRNIRGVLAKIIY